VNPIATLGNSSSDVGNFLWCRVGMEMTTETWTMWVISSVESVESTLGWSFSGTCWGGGGGRANRPVKKAEGRSCRGSSSGCRTGGAGGKSLGFVVSCGTNVTASGWGKGSRNNRDWDHKEGGRSGQWSAPSFPPVHAPNPSPRRQALSRYPKASAWLQTSSFSRP